MNEDEREQVGEELPTEGAALMAGAPKILVVLEGGVIQGIFSDSPELDCEVVTIDYATDEDANALVRQPDGSLERAWVDSWRPTASKIEIVCAREGRA
jgi:hypothetical protein